MLEEKIKNLRIKMLAFAGAFGLYACAPSLTVPTQVPGTSGYVATNRDCCAQLGCTSKGYDGCELDSGEEYNTQTGIYEQNCSCYDNTPPAPAYSSSSSSDRDPGYSRSDNDRNERSSGGHRECKHHDN